MNSILEIGLQKSKKEWKIGDTGTFRECLMSMEAIEGKKKVILIGIENLIPIAPQLRASMKNRYS